MVATTRSREAIATTAGPSLSPSARVVLQQPTQAPGRGDGVLDEPARTTLWTGAASLFGRFNIWTTTARLSRRLSESERVSASTSGGEAVLPSRLEEANFVNAAPTNRRVASSEDAAVATHDLQGHTLLHAASRVETKQRNADETRPSPNRFRSPVEVTMSARETSLGPDKHHQDTEMREDCAATRIPTTTAAGPVLVGATWSINRPSLFITMYREAKIINRLENVNLDQQMEWGDTANHFHCQYLSLAAQDQPDCPARHVNSVDPAVSQNEVRGYAQRPSSRDCDARVVAVIAATTTTTTDEHTGTPALTLPTSERIILRGNGLPVQSSHCPLQTGPASHAVHHAGSKGGGSGNKGPDIVRYSLPTELSAPSVTITDARLSITGFETVNQNMYGTRFSPADITMNAPRIAEGHLEYLHAAHEMPQVAETGEDGNITGGTANVGPVLGGGLDAVMQSRMSLPELDYNHKLEWSDTTNHPHGQYSSPSTQLQYDLRAHPANCVNSGNTQQQVVANAEPTGPATELHSVVRHNQERSCELRANSKAGRLDTTNQLSPQAVQVFPGSSIPIVQDGDTLKSLRQRIDEYAKAMGFKFTVRKTLKDKDTEAVYEVRLECSTARRSRDAASEVKASCPVFVTMRVKDSKVRVTKGKYVHNHKLSPGQLGKRKRKLTTTRAGTPESTTQQSMQTEFQARLLRLIETVKPTESHMRLLTQLELASQREPALECSTAVAVDVKASSGAQATPVGQGSGMLAPGGDARAQKRVCVSISRTIVEAAPRVVFEEDTSKREHASLTEPTPLPEHHILLLSNLADVIPSPPVSMLSSRSAIMVGTYRCSGFSIVAAKREEMQFLLKSLASGSFFGRGSDDRGDFRINGGFCEHKFRFKKTHSRVDWRQYDGTLTQEATRVTGTWSDHTGNCGDFELSVEKLGSSEHIAEPTLPWQGDLYEEYGSLEFEGSTPDGLTHEEEFEREEPCTHPSRSSSNCDASVGFHRSSRSSDSLPRSIASTENANAFPCGEYFFTGYFERCERSEFGVLGSKEAVRFIAVLGGRDGNSISGTCTHGLDTSMVVGHWEGTRLQFQVRWSKCQYADFTGELSRGARVSGTWSGSWRRRQTSRGKFQLFVSRVHRDAPPIETSKWCALCDSNRPVYLRKSFDLRTYASGRVEGEQICTKGRAFDLVGHFSGQGTTGSIVLLKISRPINRLTEVVVYEGKRCATLMSGDCEGSEDGSFAFVQDFGN